MGKRRQTLRAFGALPCAAALMGLTACSTLRPPMTTALLTYPPADLPRRKLLPDIPFHPDDGTLCGPATLSAVLEAAGFKTSPEVLKPQVYLPSREGSLQIEMTAAAARAGALAVISPPSLETLLKEVSDGHPALVLLNLSLPIWPKWHYAVVVGYDLTRDQIILNSGTHEHAVWSLTTFENTWARSRHWALIVQPPDRLPLLATPDAVQQAILSLERTHGSAAAKPAWQAAAARWPDKLVFAIGLGNARYATGDKAGAAHAFEDAAVRHNSAAAWNNLAQVRWELGQASAARDAAWRAWQCANTQEPEWIQAVRDTFAQLGISTPPTLAASQSGR